MHTCKAVPAGTRNLVLASHPRATLGLQLHNRLYQVGGGARISPTVVRPQRQRRGAGHVRAAIESDPEEIVRRFANLDYKRVERTGLPEVVWGPGKSPQQVATILERLANSEEKAIATRITPEVSSATLSDRRTTPKL